MEKLKNKEFIISFVSCIFLVLALCYFGVNNYVNDTYAATVCKCRDGKSPDASNKCYATFTYYPTVPQCNESSDKLTTSTSNGNTTYKCERKESYNPTCETVCDYSVPTLCPENYYSSGSGSCFNCIPCGEGKTSSKGSTSSAQCKVVTPDNAGDEDTEKHQCVAKDSCPINQYSEEIETGCYVCKTCSDGKISSAGSFGSGSCKTPSSPGGDKTRTVTVTFGSTVKTCKDLKEGIACQVVVPSGIWGKVGTNCTQLWKGGETHYTQNDLSFESCSDTPKDPSDPNPNPGNPGGDTPDGGDGTPDGGIGGGTEDDGSTNGNGGNGGVQNNPQTGEIAIFVCWLVGITAIGYAIWYFKEIKEN